MSKEQTNKKEIWNPHFYNAFLGFEDVALIWRQFKQAFLLYWPHIADYQHMANALGFNMLGALPLSFIDNALQDNYEKTIYETCQIPTRLACWHDFFNNLTWMRWPKLKRAIIEKSMRTPKLSGRTALHNTLAHFDECGVILVSSDDYFFQLLKNHEWQAFFQNTKLTDCVKPILIGHGILEKCLNPYIGLTAKGIFLYVDHRFFKLSQDAQHQYIDVQMAAYIESNDFPTEPRALQPFPLLGWPNWHENQDALFYSNTDYFRKTRNVD